MKSRRWITWAAFTVCALAVIEGLGWTTYQLLRAEKREMSREVVDLALWRMDSALAPIIAREAGTPYPYYEPFYPAERAYTRMWEPVLPGEVLFPSPLLLGRSEFVRLHFQRNHDGHITSPEVPTGNELDLAEASLVPSDRIIAAEQDLGRLAQVLSGTRVALGDANRPDAASDRVLSEPELAPVPRSSSKKSAKEYQARRQIAEQAQSLSQTEDLGVELADTRSDAGRAVGGDRKTNAGMDFDRLEQSPPTPTPTPPTSPTPPRKPRIDVGDLTPQWRHNATTDQPELLLIRTVTFHDGDAEREITQGVWLDWPALSAHLLGTIEELLPGATLVPLDEAHAEARLAGIPAALVIPHNAAGAGWTGGGLTSTRLTLLVTWLAVLFSVGAIGLVLRASISLSDRRGRFVSAVTHELRTPLTTFCLYSQMLADGMVDESARGEYLGTLKHEADRLAGIVENVLEYARLGEKPAPKSLPPIPVPELLAPIIPALQDRAQRASMTLVDETGDESVSRARVAADTHTVERILANLVENACKYAVKAGEDGEVDRRIHVGVRAGSESVFVTIADHGPGVARSQRRRIFTPFHQADDGGGNGLGLGLALARGLARQLGGDLTLAEAGATDGACFVLRLPIVTQ